MRNGKSRNEVLTTLIQFGECSIHDLAELTGLDRTVVYLAARKLIIKKKVIRVGFDNIAVDNSRRLVYKYKIV